MKLASIERIKSVEKHPNADTLSIVSCAGYKAIVKTGSFSEGDLCVFVQPDCVLPDAPWSAFYKSKSKRVKACKIRQIWSMGVVESIENVGLFFRDSYEEGQEVADIIGVTKYEAPAPQDLSAKGSLPFGIFKSDEENWQSLDNIPYGEVCDVTMKYEGQSGSFAYKNVPDRETFAICSRSLEIKPECENNFTRIAAKYNIKAKLSKFCEENKVNLCLRGECFGGNIQNFKPNPHAGFPLDFTLYNVLNLDTLKYEIKDSPFYYTKVAAALGLKTVDLLEENVIITPELIEKYDSKLEKINGKHYEGCVLKFHKGGSLKIRNKSYDALK